MRKTGKTRKSRTTKNRHFLETKKSKKWKTAKLTFPGNAKVEKGKNSKIDISRKHKMPKIGNYRKSSFPEKAKDTKTEN